MVCGSLEHMTRILFTLPFLLFFGVTSVYSGGKDCPETAVKQEAPSIPAEGGGPPSIAPSVPPSGHIESVQQQQGLTLKPPGGDANQGPLVGPGSGDGRGGGNGGKPDELVGKNPFNHNLVQRYLDGVQGLLDIKKQELKERQHEKEQARRDKEAWHKAGIDEAQKEVETADKKIQQPFDDFVKKDETVKLKQDVLNYCKTIHNHYSKSEGPNSREAQKWQSAVEGATESLRTAEGERSQSKEKLNAMENDWMSKVRTLDAAMNHYDQLRAPNQTGPSASEVPSLPPVQ